MKKHLSLKKYFLLSLSIIMLVNNTIAASAANLGTLSYWHSDKNAIGRWNKSSIKIYYLKLNNKTSFYFSGSIIFAYTAWDDVTGISFTSSSSSSNASSPIQYYGGTVSEINTLGKVTVSSNEAGLTVSTYSVEGTWKYGSTTKEGRLISKAVGCIVDQGSGHTQSQYINTGLHELGHALGWTGHSSSSSDVMYKSNSSVETLTNRDKRHLSQVY